MKLITADCVEAMADMEADSIDAIVCDPPYSLGFMSKAWDIQHDHEPWSREAYRILKPGAHLLAFGGTRTYHRLACAVEDAGFEIRDSLLWLYGSGFPKSLDVSKAIDKAAGAEREVVGFNASARIAAGSDRRNAEQGKRALIYNDETGCDITAPATPDAQRWQGWGTALKPSHEPIVVARKPLAGTVAANVLAHGTGALNIDGCRVESDEEIAGGGGWAARQADETDGWKRPYHNGVEPTQPHTSGRWPPNVILSPESAAELDEQSGEQPARFYYVAKASRAERNAGAERNVHPTVKPLALMRWLVRLVTPPNGLILDPFTGSGTTGAAAALEGFDFIGIEREPEYALIAEARIAFWSKYPGADVDAVLASDARAREVEDAGQLNLGL